MDPRIGDDTRCVFNTSIACASLGFAMAQPVFSAHPQTTFVLAPGEHLVKQLIFRAPYQKITGLAYHRRHDISALPKFGQYYVHKLDTYTLIESMLTKFHFCFYSFWGFQVNSSSASVLNCLQSLCFNLSNSNIPMLLAGVQFQNANGIMQVILRAYFDVSNHLIHYEL